MPTTSAGIVYHDPTMKASVAIGTANLANSINTKIVGDFANTTERDAAYAGLSGAQKDGIICYRADRQGHQRFSLTYNKWLWLREENVLFDGTYSPGADVNTSNGTGGITLLGIGTPVTLPPGNRRIMVHASMLVTNLDAPTNTSSSPRAILYGTGVGVGAQSFMQTWLPPGAQNFQAILSRTFVLTLNGTCDIAIRGTVVNGGFCRFSDTKLTIIDTGPTDG